MSYKYGGFHDTCEEYEVITAYGEVLHCTPNNENSLLFQMVHGTFGTLGIISKLKFKLIPSKPSVKVRFEKYHDLSDYKEAIWNHMWEKDIDFMDGFVHSPNEYVINTGDFVDEAPYTHDYGWKRTFCQSSKKLNEDFLKTPDYFFRYDKGVTHHKSFTAGFLVGRFITSNEILKLAERFHSFMPSDRIPITVDLLIPFSRVEEFIDWYKKEIDYYPLWCVPYKKVRNYEWLSEEFVEKTHDELFLDLAIYGMRRNNNYYRIIEEELMKIGGIKTLISNNYYSESEFWKIWNKDNYYKVKNKTDPNNIFRDLYTKTCRASRGLGI
jgi:FAD/FMN-containing dehydrogenase